MTVYYINFLLILGLAFPLCIYKPSRLKSIVYLFITFGWMWLIATFRYGIGFDYNSYIDIFNRIRETQGIPALWRMSYEFGFTFLTKAMTFYITSPTVMYGVYEVIILLPVAWFIYTYCKDVWLSTWLYVTLTFFYTTMNFTRQSLACSFSLLGYKFLRERKPVPYFIVILLAASFHKTALIMIPIYFLCHIKLTKKIAIFYGSAVLVLYATSRFILDFITNYIFKSYKDSYYLNPLGLRYLLIPLMILATCLCLKPAWEKRDPDSTMLTNMMLFSTVIWLFLTKHFILERFSMYPYILLLVALPTAISSLKASEEDYAELAALSTSEHPEGGKKKRVKSGKASKEIPLRRSGLSKKIKERQLYYWSAVTAVLFVTFIYHSLGNGMNFHNVFPYQSVLDWQWL